MDPDEYTYSEHLKRLEAHADANAKPCHFCQVDHHESNLTKIKATQDLICWGCLTEMTPEQAVKYLKASEDRVDPKTLCDFINDLFPHNSPYNYSNPIVNK